MAKQVRYLRQVNTHPKISWDRTKTIGCGDDVCDFKVHIREN